MKLNVDAREAGAAYALIFTPSTWRARMTREAIIRFHVQVCTYGLRRALYLMAIQGCGRIAHTDHDLQ